MSDEHNRSVALLGGPESGKTTYLGTLVDALQLESIQDLRLHGLASDSRAMEHLTEALLDGHYPQRTKAERHMLELPIVATEQGRQRPFTLRVGDYDGEEVERLFRDRNRGFIQEWKDRAHADGLLIFFRPPAVRPLWRPPGQRAPTEDERWRHLAGLLTDPAPVASPAISAGQLTPDKVFGPSLIDEEAPAPRPAQPDDPMKIPTVLAIIELLQFLRHVRGLAPGERPPRGSLRVALMVAAWDAVDRDWQQRGAAAYLSEEMPLLEDFLWCNFHGDDVFRFGLSSTGGNLNNPDYQARYLDHEERGYVTWTNATGQVVRSADISIPIKWALFGDHFLHPDGTET